MREKHQSATSCTPLTGGVPITKVLALNWNRIWDPSVRMPTEPNQLGLYIVF